MLTHLWGIHEAGRFAEKFKSFRGICRGDLAVLTHGFHGPLAVGMATMPFLVQLEDKKQLDLAQENLQRQQRPLAS